MAGYSLVAPRLRKSHRGDIILAAISDGIPEYLIEIICAPVLRTRHWAQYVILASFARFSERPTEIRRAPGFCELHCSDAATKRSMGECCIEIIRAPGLQ